MTERVTIRALPSGVPGLDEVLGGGIPEFSFNLIVGGPGCGKTTLGHQIVFENASPTSSALYITIIGEPPLKMLRYQQQFTFFDASKVDGSVRVLHLGDDARDGGLELVFNRIVDEVARTQPAIVVVDSFRSLMRRPPGAADVELQDFVQRLALHLTTRQATSFLVGELEEDESDSPIFTVADGILCLKQASDRNSIVRKLKVLKMRGQEQIPGLHTMRITRDGVSVFPRLPKPDELGGFAGGVEHRLETGAAELDTMFGGGIPRGYSVLIAGPSGSGKTILANQFVLEGARRGEPGVIAVFERRPNDYINTTPFGGELERLIKQGMLEILYLRPLDLSIDETLVALLAAVKRTGAKRAVIDSLSGLELALAPTFREDFRESLYRMIGAVTGLGVTVMATVEVSDSFVDLRFSPQGIAFLTDAIVIQRYVEIGGELRRVLGVVKVRGSQHSKELREYEITESGTLQIGEAINGYDGILSGRPVRRRRGSHGTRNSPT